MRAQRSTMASNYCSQFRNRYCGWWSYKAACIIHKHKSNDVDGNWLVGRVRALPYRRRIIRRPYGITRCTRVAGIPDFSDVPMLTPPWSAIVYATLISPLMRPGYSRGPLSDTFPANHGNYFRACKCQRKGESSYASGTIPPDDKNEHAWLRTHRFHFALTEMFASPL